MSEYASAQGRQLEIRQKLNKAGIQYDPDNLDSIDATLRRKLWSEWMLKSNADSAKVLKAIAASEDVDDEWFVEKVKKFQKKHELTEDGILGPNTLDFMHQKTKWFTEFEEDDEPTPETPASETQTTIPGATEPTPIPAAETTTTTTPSPAEMQVVTSEDTSTAAPAAPVTETTAAAAPIAETTAATAPVAEAAPTTTPVTETTAAAAPVAEQPAEDTPRLWFGDLHKAESDEKAANPEFPPAKFIPLSDSPDSPLATTPPTEHNPSADNSQPTVPPGTIPEPGMVTIWVHTDGSSETTYAPWEGPSQLPTPETTPTPPAPSPTFPPAPFIPTAGWIMH